MLQSTASYQAIVATEILNRLTPYEMAIRGSSLGGVSDCDLYHGPAAVR